MKRTILAAALAMTAIVATSGTSQAQVITAGYGTPYYAYGYSPAYGYNNYGYNYGTGFSFSYGNYQPYYGGYSTGAFVGPRYYGNNYYGGYRSNFYSGYRGGYGYRGYRR